jgi:hypothetical protein
VSLQVDRKWDPHKEHGHHYQQKTARQRAEEYQESNQSLGYDWKCKSLLTGTLVDGTQDDVRGSVSRTQPELWSSSIPPFCYFGPLKLCGSQMQSYPSSHSVIYRDGDASEGVRVSGTGCAGRDSDRIRT